MLTSLLLMAKRSKYPWGLILKLNLPGPQVCQGVATRTRYVKRIFGN